MNKFAKFSTTAAIVSTLALSLSAGAGQAADINKGGAFSTLNAVSADRFVSIIGNGTSAEVAALTSGARTVNVIAIGNVYSGEAWNDINDALEEEKRFSVKNLQTQLASNPSAQSWLNANGVDTNSVLSIDSSEGRINLYVAG